MAKSAQKKIDPFKTKKAKAEVSQANDTLTPPETIAEAIDQFREAQDQYKHFEGEMTIYKDQILDFSNQEFSKRLFKGYKKSFKILGNESSITYVVMDASAGLTEEDVAQFAEQWGEAAAEALIVRDFGSIRFNPPVLEEYYDQVVEALQVLPPKVLESLFKPLLMKARPGAAEAAKKYATTPDQLKDLLRGLKIKNYIR